MVIDFTPLFEKMEAVYNMQTIINENYVLDIGELVNIGTVLILAEAFQLGLMIIMLIAMLLKR